jgi:hypothetical protein
VEIEDDGLVDDNSRERRYRSQDRGGDREKFGEYERRPRYN